MTTGKNTLGLSSQTTRHFSSSGDAFIVDIPIYTHSGRVRFNF